MKLYKLTVIKNAKISIAGKNKKGRISHDWSYRSEKSIR